MKSEYIEEIFEDYLKTPQTQYAILINGAWGSGKTYFFKNKLVAIATRESFNTVYLTLNGLSKIEDFKYQFLVKLIPILNQLDPGKANIIKTIISTVAQKIGSININDILKDIEIDTSKLAKYVVCFDDLERCSIPKEEVLGFINNYVEHKNLKVLILSDETKINGNEIYNSIKEKVIGRILNYSNNLETTIPLLLEKYKSNQPDFYQAVIDKNDFILELLVAFKQENLRNISFYFTTLSKLYPEVKNHIAYWKEVIFFSLIITIEFKAGNLTSNDYNSFKGLDEIDTAYGFFGRTSVIDTSLTPEDNQKKESEAEKFYNKYVVNRISDFHFYRSIYVYILTGYLEDSKFNEELSNRYPPVISEEVQVFRDIISFQFRTLKDDDFSDKVAKVIKFSEEGKYPIYDYVGISNFLVYFSKNGLIENTVEDIHEILLRGIEISKKSKAISQHLYRSMFHFKHDTDDNIIWEAVKKAHEDILKEIEEKKINALLEAVKSSKIEEVEKVFSEYQADPGLFALLSPKDLAEALLMSSNQFILEFNTNLSSRYSASNIKDYLNPDNNFLQQLKLELENQKGLDGKVRLLLISELIESISKILIKIN